MQAAFLHSALPLYKQEFRKYCTKRKREGFALLNIVQFHFQQQNKIGFQREFEQELRDRGNQIYLIPEKLDISSMRIFCSLISTVLIQKF